MNKSVFRLVVWFFKHIRNWKTFVNGEDGEYQVNCKYYEASDFVHALNGSKCDFADFSFNIRSLSRKWDDFLQLILELNQGSFPKFF